VGGGVSCAGKGGLREGGRRAAVGRQGGGTVLKKVRERAKQSRAGSKCRIIEVQSLKLQSTSSTGVSMRKTLKRTLRCLRFTTHRGPASYVSCHGLRERQPFDIGSLVDALRNGGETLNGMEQVSLKLIRFRIYTQQHLARARERTISGPKRNQRPMHEDAEALSHRRADTRLCQS